MPHTGKPTGYEKNIESTRRQARQQAGVPGASGRFIGRNFFDRDRAPFRENDFGSGVGGPIFRNKLFFFASYEGERNRKGQTLQGLYPSQAQLQGNLADDSYGTGIFPTNSAFCSGAPQSTKCKNIVDPGTKVPFPGNVIPASRISNFARKFIDCVPAANALERLPLGRNRLVNPSIVSDWDQWSIRIDHNISSKDSACYRYIRVNEPLFQPGINPGGGSNTPLEGRNFAAGWTRMINTQLVNAFHAGWNKGVWQQTANSPAAKPTIRSFWDCRILPRILWTGSSRESAWSGSAGSEGRPSRLAIRTKTFSSTIR